MSLVDRIEELKEGIYVLKGATNIGILRFKGNEAVVIDTGLDKDVGKRILKALDILGLHLSVIINTHSHADHCGGNHFLIRRTDACVYASKLEAAIIENTLFEPIYLFCGAYPIEELKVKFLMAKPSHVDHHLEEIPSSLEFDDLHLKILCLKGHSWEQIGVEAKGVLFCGDALFPE